MIRRPPRSTLFPLHDALPISVERAPAPAGSTGDPARGRALFLDRAKGPCAGCHLVPGDDVWPAGSDPSRGDRKSTRLNSSHGYISYAVFCLEKKKLAPRPTTA